MDKQTDLSTSSKEPDSSIDVSDKRSSSREATPVPGRRAHPSPKVFALPTISVEESSVPDISELVKSSAICETDGGEKEKEMAGEREVVVKVEKHFRESTPSLDGESESVSLGIREDEDTDSEGNSLSSNGSSLLPRRDQKAMSMGQVHLPSSLRRKRRNGSSILRNARSENERFDELQAEELEKRLKALAAAFSARTTKAKAKIRQPPTPSSEESEPEDLKPGEATLLDRLRQLASPAPSAFGETASRRKSIVSTKVKGTFWENVDYCYNFITCNYILDPQSSIYVGWLVVVSIVFAYNASVVPLRVVFPYQTEENELIWFTSDCIADLIYFVDILIFKPHVKFLQSGFWVKEPKQTMKAYVGTMQFKVDLIALFPADIVSHFVYRNMPILRIVRILKMEAFSELFRRLELILAQPHRARIFHTCLYMLYMIHLVACTYYALSTYEGIGMTSWTYDGEGNAYVRCFYFATKTATSIGKNPKPDNELEYTFMTFAWLSGVFVTAILIGQIRDIIATATKSQTEYRILTSSTASYLHRLGVPRKLQDRVKLWLSYTWEQQKTLDETRILNLLPKTMKAEIALNIHVETLGKVKLFQSCETAFLRDLVVKLRSIIILPGDFVCRKGEIGREMFIVKSGKIQVIGGPSGTQVLASLGEGSVFGEIALLGIGGMNKRTADVRAAGFVNLFVLIKSDLNDVIRDYPEAQDIMQRKAKKLMRENIKKARATPSSVGTPEDNLSLVEESGVIIKNKEETPQLMQTMMKLFHPTSKIGRFLRKGTMEGSLTDLRNTDGEIVPKPDEIYTSLTSYPPSPFMPISPGHISQQLDISIMTGDSSDKMLSRPDSQNSLNLSMSIPEDDEIFDKEPDEIDRCQSSLPPFLRNEDIPYKELTTATPLPTPPETVEVECVQPKHLKEPRKSCPQLESFTDTNRETIPIERRPPLYIIQAGASTPVADSTLRTRVLRRIVLQSESVGSSVSVEEEDVSYHEEDEGKKIKEVSSDTTNKVIKQGTSSTTALIASRFISRIRGPLERHRDVDVEIEGDQERGEDAPGTKEEYSLDIEDD